MSLSAELVSYLESLPEPHILFDRGYRILAANAAYRLRFSPDRSVIGKTCYAVSHRFDQPCDASGESCPLAQARASGHRERVLHRHHTPHGETYVDIELTPVRNAAGEIAYFVEKMEALAGGRTGARGERLVGRSERFQRMMGLVARVAPSGAAVLLQGESGTGKELVARAIHEASPRASGPLVIVDCASLTETLFESELFGHERGAFTGAVGARTGLVEAAHHGTLFLDEVGDIPLTMQVKLLRLLETGTYRRVGSTELRHADLRIVSATHRDLHAMIAEGRFRQDLFFRLAVFPIELPALRERTGDLRMLAESLLERLAPDAPPALDDDTCALLADHDFPGNVRELRNLLERAMLLGDDRQLTPQAMAEALQACRPRRHRTDQANEATPARLPENEGSAAGAVADALTTRDNPRTLKAIEQAALLEQLRQHHGSRAELARRLGISERSLYRKLSALQALDTARAPDALEPSASKEKGSE